MAIMAGCESRLNNRTSVVVLVYELPAGVIYTDSLRTTSSPAILHTLRVTLPVIAAACADDVSTHVALLQTAAAVSSFAGWKHGRSPAGSAMPLTAGWCGPDPPASGAQRGGSAAGQPYVASTTTSPPCHRHPAAPHQEAQQYRIPPGILGQLPSGCLYHLCRCCFESGGTLDRVLFTIGVSSAMISAHGWERCSQNLQLSTFLVLPGITTRDPE